MRLEIIISFKYHLFRFPTDMTARVIDRQFLWGGELLITPVLTEVMSDLV